jgi:hypothetical protein
VDLEWQDGSNASVRGAVLYIPENSGRVTPSYHEDYTQLVNPLVCAAMHGREMDRTAFSVGKGRFAE